MSFTILSFAEFPIGPSRLCPQYSIFNIQATTALVLFSQIKYQKTPLCQSAPTAPGLDIRLDGSVVFQKLRSSTEPALT